MSALESSAGGRCEVASIWDFHHPERMETEVRARLTEAGGSSSDSQRAQLLTQLARSLGLQGRFADAHQVLDDAAALIGEERALATIRYLLERGRIFYLASLPDRSRPLFLLAWDLAVDLGEDYYAVDAAHMLGIVEPAGPALEWNRTALHLAGESQRAGVDVWMGCLYNNMGWIHFEQADYATALSMFEKSRESYEALARRQEVLIAERNIRDTLQAMICSAVAAHIERPSM